MSIVDFIRKYRQKMQFTLDIWHYRAILNASSKGADTSVRGISAFLI